MGETVLVTGCSSGIGRATALRFRDAGWTVYAAARDTDEVRTLEDRGCRVVELDVTDEASVETALSRIFEEEGRLDCLVNNAGYGQFGAVEDVPMEKVRRQFDVNTYGPIRLMRAVLPRMRERGRGTIINVTAGFGGLTVPGLGIYTGSKFALESVSDALRQETAGTGVNVVCVQPGLVATPFYDRALEEVESVEHTPAYADLYRALGSIGVVREGGPGINRPERVAATIVAAATADRPDPTYRVGALAAFGTYAAAVVRGRLRAAASRVGLEVASNGAVQRFLRRRRE
ncbi:SDR family oxidoreductase [Halopelagius fulvigenes]|uniref:SDR family oxidoreductase n=1 Tax=Halopelagius fulvigenes TaxID=1198324 RepID=A0ABD5TUG9_9EURY